MSMFCYQCEETTNGTGCTKIGVCGKDETAAALEDLIVHALKGLGTVADAAAKAGIRDDEMDFFVHKALFTTLTNVNFDPDDLAVYLKKIAAYRDALMDKLSALSIGPFNGATGWKPSDSVLGLTLQGHDVGINARTQGQDPDIVCLQEMLTYGLKGLSAYTHHADVLGKSDRSFARFVYEAFAYLDKKEQTLDELLALCMKLGEVNYAVMAALDAGLTESYGTPEPSPVRITPRKGKAILISGHDMKDLEKLLEQTVGMGIDVYTHSEMLPAHGYPELKKYDHLAGNYGGAWHRQIKEFDAFPGPIIMTSNCIQKPKKSYKDRIFTCGPVAWPGVKHIDGYDFSEVIAQAQAMEGFVEDVEEKTVLTGFGHAAVLNVAGTIVDAVKSGALSHFYLVGGCDGRKKERSYYTDFVDNVPDDAVVLTLGCAKFRFYDKEMGDIGGIPRLLDMGQCNDAYSAIQVAVALANAFETDVNSLPLTLNISWVEQKAVCILLTLLHLGIKNVHLGPTLPAFITPNILNFLVENFGVTGITDAKNDLATWAAT